MSRGGSILPLELVERVLSHVDREDTATYRSCALVHRSWTPHVQEWIFYQVACWSHQSLNKRNNFWKHLFALLDDSPHIRPLIRCLTLDSQGHRVMNGEGIAQTMMDPDAWAAAGLARVADYAVLFPRVEDVDFHNCSVPFALRILPSFPALTAWSIGGGYIPDGAILSWPPVPQPLKTHTISLSESCEQLSRIFSWLDRHALVDGDVLKTFEFSADVSEGVPDAWSAMVRFVQSRSSIDTLTISVNVSPVPDHLRQIGLVSRTLKRLVVHIPPEHDGLDTLFKLLQHSQLPALRRLDICISSRPWIPSRVFRPFCLPEDVTEAPQWTLPSALANALQRVDFQLTNFDTLEDMPRFTELFGPAGRPGVFHITRESFKHPLYV